MYEIRYYLTRGGKNPLDEWYRRILDSKTRLAIDRRISRAELGNFGDHKFLKDGVWELRLAIGPGVRIYYAVAGTRIILLLSGGDKGSQRSDIEKACAYWKDWQEREEERV
jgi:putative addiction module killer protein